MEMGGYLVATLTIWIWIICFTRINSAFAAQRETPKTKDISSIFHSNIGSNKNFINIDEQINGPYFDRTASKNVSALLGKTAYLNCRVKNLGNKTQNLIQVSWVRHRDVHLLTVGRYTYTSDQRFRAIHHAHTEDWILQIKYPQHRDSGIYECQISTTPHMSHYIHLNVIEPSTDIIGGPDMYIEAGSTINLTCVVKNSPEPPAYIYWNHNNVIISYDSPRGGVSVVTDKGKITKSSLLITNARTSDSGQYQCNPSNSKSKTVNAHVLNGEIPEAMQRAGQTKTFFFLKNYYFHIYVLIMFYINFNFKKLLIFLINLFIILLKKFTNILMMLMVKMSLTIPSAATLSLSTQFFTNVMSSHILQTKPFIFIHKYNYR